MSRAHLFEDEAEVETATVGDLNDFCDFIDQNAGTAVADAVDETGFIDPAVLTVALQRGVDEREAAHVVIDEQEIKAIVEEAYAEAEETAVVQPIPPPSPDVQPDVDEEMPDWDPDTTEPAAAAPVPMEGIIESGSAGSSGAATSRDRPSAASASPSPKKRRHGPHRHRQYAEY